MKHDDAPDDDDNIWEGWRKGRQERHHDWYQQNMAVLQTSGLAYKHKPQDTVVLFRIEGKPMVDFYPHTGRWRIVGKEGKGVPTFRGMAHAFLAWYGKQEVKR